jgi:rRNA maturation endonuclease Nob1
MRGDFSRFGHDSFKQYIAAFMQQGRVQLDSDWNQNVENFLNMLWKQSRDSLGACACVGDSFRVDKNMPIDHMLQAELWKPVDVPPDRQAYIFLNANDRPRTYTHSATEKGSLFVENAGGILRKFDGLDLSRFKSVYIMFKVIGSSFQICQLTLNCPRCNRPYKKGENQYCTNCGTELKEEEQDEYSSNQSSNNKEVLSLKLRLYPQRQGNGKQDKQPQYYEYEGEFVEDVDAGGFCKVRFNLLRLFDLKNLADDFDLSNISKLSVHWKKVEDTTSPFTAVGIGLVSAEPMALVVSADPDVHANGSWANHSANLNNNNNTVHPAQQNSISYTYNGKPTIMKPNGTKEISWSFSSPKNFHALNILRFAIRNKGEQEEEDESDSSSTSYNNNSTYSSSKLFLVDSNDNTLEYTLDSKNRQDHSHWRYYIVNINKPDNLENNSTDDLKEILKEITTIGLKGLAEDDSLYISEILGELNFENDFLISGDIGLNHSARMYVNGLLCSMEHWNTYLTQKDVPSDNADYLLTSSSVAEKADAIRTNRQERYSAKQLRKPIYYMVYTDVWNRGITHLEDPEIREVALGGPDTATRLQTVCQIKLKEIKDDEGVKEEEDNSNGSRQHDLHHVNFQEKINIGEQKIKEMNEERSGRLTIISSPNSTSLLRSDASFGTIGNHLYRVQIHDSGESKGHYNSNKSRRKNADNNNNNTTFKWSKDNASVAFPIKQLYEDKVVLDQGARSLASVFRIGDLIEIIDDVDELSEQPRGHLRRISHVDIDNRTLSWSSGLNSDQTEIRYLHDPIKSDSKRYRSGLHPKVILWDGIKYVNTTEGEVEEDSSDRLISLDGSSGIDRPIRIRFDPGVFSSGDYWTFATRSNGSIELLKSAKPMGTKHHYAILALVRKQIGKEIEVIADLRHTFQPLTDLRAIDIPYDNGDNMHSGAMTVQAALQRLSGARIRVLSGRRNNRTIKDLSMEAGEIYELKRSKRKQGTLATTISFNDIYEHQPFLLYTIRSGNNFDVRHEIHMLATDEEGNIFRNPVDDGTKNYAWKGFEIEAEENAQVSWLAIGDSYTYFERFVKRVLDEILRVIFGVDTDQLKDDNSVLEAWYKNNLRKLSESGPDLAKVAKEHWDTLQNDFDRWVRNVDKQVKNLQEDLEEALDFEEEEKEEKKEKGEEKEKEEEEEGREFSTPSAQTVNCVQCGRSFPKRKYTYCTNCGTLLPT